jgi:hypothetical protein
MHQLLLWAALEAEGLGANTQHYNPLIDEEVSKFWISTQIGSLSRRWSSVSQWEIDLSQKKRSRSRGDILSSSDIEEAGWQIWQALID